jgi:hypothetical protein
MQEAMSLAGILDATEDFARASEIKSSIINHLLDALADKR